MDGWWKYWKKLFGEIVDAHIPLKRARVRRKALPWITQEIRDLMRAKGKWTQERDQFSEGINRCG